MKKHLPGWAVLLIITLAAGLALGATYALTKDPIDEQTRIAAENARKAALPEASRFALLYQADKSGPANSVDWIYAGLGNPKTMPLDIQDIDAISGATMTTQGVVDGLNEAYAAYQADSRSPEEKNTAVFSGEGKGYKGDPIYVEATFDDRVITSISIGDDRFAETPTLGGQALEYAFQRQFTDPVGYVAQKTVKGFGGEVEVIAGVNAQDQDHLVLGGISVGGANFSETAGLGAKSKDAAFTDQFKNKPLSNGLKLIKAGEEKADNTIDAITSASITSNAVVNGVNTIVEEIKVRALGIADIAMPEKPTDTPVFSASAQGFRGPVYVEAAFDQNSQITYISVGDDSFAEDVGADAVKPKFMIQFIGKTAPVALSDVDALSGATITTNAVLTALNDAYAQSGGGNSVAPVPTETQEPAAPADHGNTADGVYAATAQGFRGPVYVEASFDENGAITALRVGDDAFAEDVGAGVREPAFTEQFIGKTAPISEDDIDCIAGATVSSKAVIAAVNDAYAQSQSKGSAGSTDEEPEGAYAAEINASNGTVQVKIDAEGDRLTVLNVYDKPAGATAYTVSERQGAMRDLFLGSALPVSVQQDDGYALSVAVAINKAFDRYLADHPEVAPTAPDHPSDDGETFYGAVSQGFRGPVYVEASFDENGAITALRVGDDAFAEDVGAGVREPAFTDQFIGKTAPISEDDIDCIAGATVSSKAVIAAVNDAYDLYLADLCEGVPTEAPTEVPAEAPAETPTEAPTEAPAETPAPGPESRAESDTARTYTGESILFFDKITVAAAFDGDTLENVNVSRVNINTGKEAYDLEEDALLWKPLLGEKMPMRLDAYKLPGVDEATAQAVLIAVNDAYGKYLADSGVIAPAAGGGSTPSIGGETLGDENAHQGQAISFFRNICVTAAMENGRISSLQVMDKPVGSDTWQNSERQNEMTDLFVGQSLPVDTKQQDAYASAVAVAINQAFGAGAEAAADADSYMGHGSSILFFTRYEVAAGFEGDTLVDFRVFTEPVGAPVSITEAGTLNAPALYDALIGKKVPLDPTAFGSVTGVPESVVRAVAIAINQAYDNPVLDLPQ
ncbi:MAG: FMN-binding protein [Clostridia bacterium]|nr:FMN-binding protein [Clostridia bacterium]